jgi:preprotein translocase subunit SecD
MNAHLASRQRGRVSVVAVTTIAGGLLLLASIVLIAWTWLAAGRAAAFGADEPRVELVLQVKTDQIAPGESEGAIDPAQAVASVKDTIGRRLGMLGVAKWNVTRRSGDPADRLLVQVAARAGTDAEHVKALLVANGRLALQLVEGGPLPSAAALLQSFGGSLPPGTTVLKGVVRDVEGVRDTLYYLVRTAPVITGRDIARARPAFDENNQPAVSVSMTAQGAERLRRATTANVGRQLAIVIDDVVMSAPRIDGPISGEARIHGGFTQAEAADLALLLRAGSFAAPVVVVDARTVGTAGTR